MRATKGCTEARHRGRRLEATLALVLCLLLGSYTLAAAGRSAQYGGGKSNTPEPMRFSALEELTPQNVRQLRPLFAVPASIDRESSMHGAVSPSKPVRAAPTQLGSPAAADAHLRDFVRWRATLIRAPLAAVPTAVPDSVVNYIVESSGTLRAVAAAAPPQASGQLTASDPASGRVVWTARESSPIGRSAVVTAGGLVFYCSADGWFKALDARSGELLWKQRLAGAKHGEPLSYEGGDGHQYVGVLTDVSGRTGTLQTFSLPR
jgi:hypothetical protein